MLTEDSVDSRKVDKSLQKVPWMHGKLTEDSSEARKMDISVRNVQQMHGKMTEVDVGCADTRKVDGRSHCHKKSSRNVHGRTES